MNWENTPSISVHCYRCYVKTRGDSVFLTLNLICLGSCCWHWNRSRQAGRSCTGKPQTLKIYSYAISRKKSFTVCYKICQNLALIVPKILGKKKFVRWPLKALSTTGGGVKTLVIQRLKKTTFFFAASLMLRNDPFVPL